MADTPTCYAMDMLADRQAILGRQYCWTYDPCERLKCVHQRGYSLLDITILRCNFPTALRFVHWTTKDGTVFTDRVFNQSGVFTSNYKGFVVVWNVTLVHLDDGIGFEVRLLPQLLIWTLVVFSLVENSKMHTCVLYCISYTFVL